MHAFPENLSEIEQDGRILFRIEKYLKSHSPSVLIQSPLCPNWYFLLKDKDYLASDPVFKQFEYPTFQEGNAYIYRLFGNPTKKIDGKRVGMYQDEKIYKWLERKAELSGFKLIQAYINRKEKVIASSNKKAKLMTFQGIQFEGTLQVLYPNKFQNALKNGIGSGKSLGFGLLTISKI